MTKGMTAYLMDNDTLWRMARSAIENWDFNEDTDPDKRIFRGLRYISEKAFEGDVIQANVKGPEDWDGLMDFASRLGAQLI